MVLLPFFDIPSGFQLGKITEECPFQGPVFFGFSNGFIEEIYPNLKGNKRQVGVSEYYLYSLRVK